jgi:hypothetical protein
MVSSLRCGRGGWWQAGLNTAGDGQGRQGRGGSGPLQQRLPQRQRWWLRTHVAASVNHCSTHSVDRAGCRSPPSRSPDSALAVPLAAWPPALPGWLRSSRSSRPMASLCFPALTRLMASAMPGGGGGGAKTCMSVHWSMDGGWGINVLLCALGYGWGVGGWVLRETSGSSVFQFQRSVCLVF